MTDRNENSYELKKVTSEKDLGITFQQNMRYEEHISNTVNKANRLLGLVKRTFSHMDKTTFLTIYKTTIRPILDYGDSVWSPIFKKHIQMLEHIQRRGTKLVRQYPGLGLFRLDLNQEIAISTRYSTLELLRQAQRIKSAYTEI